MSISRRKIETLLKTAPTQTLKHTDIVLVAEPVAASDRLQLCTQGSGVFLRSFGVELLVTCHHVVSKGPIYFFGASRLEQPRVPRDPSEHKVCSATLLASEPDLDLAVLRSDSSTASVSPKVPYDLSDSEWVTEEILLKNKGTATLISGPPAGMMDIYATNPLYAEAAYYSATGPLIEVHQDRLIVDMAESEFVYNNSDLFPQLRNMKPTGGTRELQGISGSGLWMFDDDERVILVGIVLRRDSGALDEHRIRATPVWALRDWLKKLHENGAFGVLGGKETEA